MQEINYSVKNESNSLIIERDILTKSISRLYQQDPQLTKIQQDKLLTKYQYQLRVVNEKIENLESKKEPDVSSAKDQSIKEMDQKLSRIEKRLQELTTKFTRPNEDMEKVSKKPTDNAKKADSQILAKKNEEPSFYAPNMKTDSKPRKDLEVVTFQSTRCCEGEKVENKMFQIDGRIFSKVQMLSFAEENTNWLRSFLSEKIQIWNTIRLLIPRPCYLTLFLPTIKPCYYFINSTAVPISTFKFRYLVSYKTKNKVLFEIYLFYSTHLNEF